MAGAVTLIIVWIVSMNGVEIPAEVASAFTIIIGFIGAILSGWAVKPGTGKRRA